MPAISTNAKQVRVRDVTETAIPTPSHDDEVSFYRCYAKLRKVCREILRYVYGLLPKFASSLRPVGVFACLHIPASDRVERPLNKDSCVSVQIELVIGDFVPFCSLHAILDDESGV